ncbi:MAG: hypothetical protein CMK23_07200 [Porticoccaceae bacterium]|nr:hypothetical protein [Porticoccaceae bacterium]
MTMDQSWQRFKSNVDRLPDTFPFDFLLVMCRDCFFVVLWIGHLIYFKTRRFIRDMRGPDPLTELNRMRRRRFDALETDEEYTDDDDDEKSDDDEKKEK